MKLLGNKRLLILMLGLILFIVLMGLTYGKRGYETWPGKFVKDTVSFTQGLIYKPVGAVVTYFQEIGQIRTIYEENRVLRETLSRYARDTTRLNDLELQNQRLQDGLGFTERQKQMNKYKFRIAEVVQFIQQGKTITINLGEKDHIRPNMAVISVEGLIGRVTEVSAFYSNVQLLTGIDDKASIDSKVTTLDSKAIAVTAKGRVNETFGLIERYDPDTKMLIMTKIDRNDPLQVGDTVITSGQGLVFPRGIEVGKVVERKEGDFGITHVAMIEPLASFNHLREVFVVEVPE
ncbi:rod shape-determining protein MreC [Paenibacillus sp. UNCCL117]|uniref:rod shape-determining protein MreC n=1 Tax=unclassified Paenibacillus TaxID=185978 RepID=UPI00088C67EA|nr:MULTISPECIES: rod shape-determining protein MreC [unclassified Paenibacillus]SDD24127.1 rod shape-determining protein MreC [Paenibacillus sp. cl123]SFW41547.1 rod shape-determining protein MreC [Paenibacillus sp. UNCCL117]